MNFTFITIPKDFLQANSDRYCLNTDLFTMVLILFVNIFISLSKNFTEKRKFKCVNTISVLYEITIYKFEFIIIESLLTGIALTYWKIADIHF